ncbi:MAG: response regulator [Anaerolineales bacterium]
MIKIVLAEDHNVVRQGLEALLAREPDFHVAAQASDGRGAIEAVQQEKPDVLILDWMLPKLSGLEVLRRVSAMEYKAKVIVLSMHADESYVLEAFRHGAVGYVMKDASARHLVQAIHTCLEGERYLCPPLSERLLEEYQEKISTDQLEPYEILTEREREVLQLVAEGNTNNEIAEMLSISARTVESHRANLMRKLNLDSTADVTKYALRRGLISLE